MLRMGFGDDVAAVDAASSSHFVPLSAMMRNHKVSDRPVPGESRGPECLSLSSSHPLLSSLPPSFSLPSFRLPFLPCDRSTGSFQKQRGRLTVVKTVLGAALSALMLVTGR